MVRSLLTLAVLSIAWTPLVADNINVDSLIQKAEVNYFDLQDFNRALLIYQQIEESIRPDHKAYEYVIDKVASSLYFIQKAAAQSGNKQKAIDSAEEFVAYIEKRESQLHDKITLHKYYMLRNLVVAYFEQNKLERAEECQTKLYQGYLQGKLPNGLQQSYNFDRFESKGMVIMAFESFETPESAGQNKPFVKHSYKVYPEGRILPSDEPLFTLETSRILNSQENGLDRTYVLSKHVTGTDRATDTPYWRYTFSEDVEYSELRDAVLAVISKDEKGKRKRR